MNEPGAAQDFSPTVSLYSICFAAGEDQWLSDSTVTMSIEGRSESGICYRIQFVESEDEADVVKAFFSLEKLVTSVNLVISLRKQCHLHNTGFYVPNDNSLKQPERLCLAAAASYPSELPAEFIEGVLAIPYNSYRMYVSSHDQESRKFLSLGSEKQISISFDGVRWIAVRLSPDAQSLTG